MLRMCTSLSASCCRASSSTAGMATPAALNKTEEAGVAHVTSINIHANDRSVVQLASRRTGKVRKFRRQYTLPDAATTGLRNVLFECSRSPKQIQHEADQLQERLNQRRFPASPQTVKMARDFIKRKLRAEHDANGESFESDQLLSDKIREAREYQLRSKVDKLLKKSNFNWKPLEFTSRESAATYALARLAPNYAEIARVLEELTVTNFCPKTVLDFGSGSAAGFWAIHELYKDALIDYCLVDISDNMTKLAMDIMRNEDGTLVSKRVSFRRHLVPSLNTTYDLVFAHRSLEEIGSLEGRMQLIESLWMRTNRFLVMIESGSASSFDAVLDARDYIISKGFHLKAEQTFKLLSDNGLLNTFTQSVMHDRSLSEFERFSIIREKVPEDLQLPTELPTASIFAPCPHDLGCPLLGKKEACSFPVRWTSLRADGRTSPREKDGTGTGRISFTILEKCVRQPEVPVERILKMRKMNGHVTCDVCTAYKGIQRLTVSKRAGSLYEQVRARRDGDLFPLTLETKVTEGTFDVYDHSASDVNISP